MKKILLSLSAFLFMTSCAASKTVVRFKEVSFCSEFNHTTVLGKSGVECRILWCERDIVDASALMPGDKLSVENGLPPELVKSRVGNVTTLWCIPTEISDTLKQEANPLKKKTQQQKEILPMFEQMSDGGVAVMPAIKGEKKEVSPPNEKTFPGVLEHDDAGVYKTMPFIFKK